eukprot:scaffold60600_cov68-Phaeocystis_antarctica.AAC.4
MKFKQNGGSPKVGDNGHCIDISSGSSKIGKMSFGKMGFVMTMNLDYAAGSLSSVHSMAFKQTSLILNLECSSGCGNGNCGGSSPTTATCGCTIRENSLESGDHSSVTVNTCCGGFTNCVTGRPVSSPPPPPPPSPPPPPPPSPPPSPPPPPPPPPSPPPSPPPPPPPSPPPPSPPPPRPPCLDITQDVGADEYKEDKKAGSVGVVGANGECIDIGPGCSDVGEKGFCKMGFGNSFEVNVGYDSSSTLTFNTRSFKQSSNDDVKVIMECSTGCGNSNCGNPPTNCGCPVRTTNLENNWDQNADVTFATCCAGACGQTPVLPSPSPPSPSPPPPSPSPPS